MPPGPSYQNQISSYRLQMATITFTISDIPSYLKESEFYHSLDMDDEVLTLQKQVCKFELFLTSVDDVSHLLSTMRFWGMRKIPKGLVVFAVQNPDLDLRPTLDEFTNELKSLHFLRFLGESVRDTYPGCYDSDPQIHNMKRKGSLVEDVVYILSDQFEREKGQIWNASTCAVAAQLGWLDCLIFLHENGCSWDVFTCSGAARYGHLNCLKYAHMNGCPWDAKTANKALQNRNVECFQYAKTNGCP